MQPPKFWYAKDSSIIARTVLAPAAFFYDQAAQIRERAASGKKALAPVICVGNATLGGVGKTPTAIAIARCLTGRGERPHLLTRGYKGRLAGPICVDADAHAARDVGDEPLLLAHAAPTWVAKNRIDGAAAAVDAGASAIVMDDGLQNPTIEKTFSLLLIDAEVGLGNGAVFPAGPLREPIARSLQRAQAVVFVKPSPDYETPSHIRSLAHGLPSFESWLEPARAKPCRVVAFSGIGRPEKFFQTLTRVGFDLAATRAFPDHYFFKDSEITELRDLSARRDAALITTEKDAVRLPPELRKSVLVLPVAMEFDNAERLFNLIAVAMNAARGNS